MSSEIFSLSVGEDLGLRPDMGNVANKRMEDSEPVPVPEGMSSPRWEPLDGCLTGSLGTMTYLTLASSSAWITLVCFNRTNNAITLCT
jgi:hypothetical protein